MKTTLELLEATEERCLDKRSYRGVHPTSYVRLELNTHYSGSGPKAFGGHKSWPHIGLDINLPADIPHAHTEVILRELDNILKTYGYTVE